MMFDHTTFRGSVMTRSVQAPLEKYGYFSHPEAAPGLCGVREYLTPILNLVNIASNYAGQL